MGPDEDLPTLIQRQDHLNVLRFVRAHQLRKPELVVEHGIALLGKGLSKSVGDESARLAAIEQICLAALDLQDHDLASHCLSKLKDGSIDEQSNRFKRLLARCLEASGGISGAENIYDELLQANPANLVALQRKYAMLKAQPGKEAEAMEALNKYLEQNTADPAGWYEMAKMRMDMADYKGAAYALEEVILTCPLESPLHCELAEVYSTIGGLDNLMLARKHMAQSLELDAANRRAQFGLVVVANAYLLESEKSSKKVQDEHEVAVAKELIKYGADQLCKSYKGNSMFAAVKKLMEEYQDDSSDGKGNN
jgi:ER membrane protein complex subunit 2